MTKNIFKEINLLKFDKNFNKNNYLMTNHKAIYFVVYFQVT